MHTPVISRSINGGTQRIYRFANGYGASVVRHPFSYGNKEGLFELAVLSDFKSDTEYELTYSTPITSDVIGYLTDEKVEELLTQIEALPAKVA